MRITGSKVKEIKEIQAEYNDVSRRYALCLTNLLRVVEPPISSALQKIASNYIREDNLFIRRKFSSWTSWLQYAYGKENLEYCPIDHEPEISLSKIEEAVSEGSNDACYSLATLPGGTIGWDLCTVKEGENGVSITEDIVFVEMYLQIENEGSIGVDVIIDGQTVGSFDLEDLYENLVEYYYDFDVDQS